MQWPTARGVTPERRQPSPFGQKENTPLFPPSQPVDPEPSETAAPVRATLPMQEAIRAAEEGEPNSPNPLIAEATALLILLGRLRTGMVIIDIGPLMNFTDRTLRTYRDRLLGRGVSDHDARDAQFVVAALADDIVQNLHRVDTSYWMSQPMVGRFFPSRNAGEEFYDLVHDALRSARQRRDLLQLQHLCLCLGFEGKYASPFPNGRNKIAEVRGDVYAMLEQVFGRTNDDLSPNWKPIATRRERRGFQVPFFALFGISAFLVVGAVSAGTYYNSRHSVELSTELENLHRPGGIPLREVEITPRSFDDLAEAIAAGGAEPEPEIVEVDQVGTIEDFLAEEIAREEVEVLTRGDTIQVRLSAVRFASGSSVVTEAGQALIDRVVEALSGQDGPVFVVGFTDNDGNVEDNMVLSQARAEAVAEVMVANGIDTERLTIEGRGPQDFIAENTTEEGKAANRRVEVWITREADL